jgi:flagellar hook-basal body complex protein FliE
MTINIASGAAAYADAALKLAGTSSSSTGAVKGSGTGFGDLLKEAIDGAIDTEKQGEAMSLQAATGKADINAVVTAVTNAEMTLQTVVAVRDKVVAAYQQILQMQI